MPLTTVEETLDPHGILILRLSRPDHRNAFTEAMGDDLVNVFQKARRDAQVKVIVLTGNPLGKAFCAGADLQGNGALFTQSRNENKDKSKRPMSLATYQDAGCRVGLAIMESSKPVIAAINGSAVGVGLTMTTACDIRVCAMDAKVGFPFVRRGLACETLSSWTLPRLVGLGKAQELVLTGRVFEASNAPPGLFNYVVPSKDVMPKAMELAREIVDNASPLSLALSRTLLIRNQVATPEEAFRSESKAIFTCAGSPDNVEGIMSFLEKRPPKFTTDGWSSMPDWWPYWMPMNISKI